MTENDGLLGTDVAIRPLHLERCGYELICVLHQLKEAQVP